jgi:hypothetical protein
MEAGRLTGPSFADIVDLLQMVHDLAPELLTREAEFKIRAA